MLQFTPHSGAGVSRNQTSTSAQNAITAMQPHGQNHFDIIAVGVLEPFAHLFLPAGITSMIVSTCWLGGLQFVHLGPGSVLGTRIAA